MSDARDPIAKLLYYCPAVAVDIVMDVGDLVLGQVGHAVRQMTFAGGKGIVSARTARDLGLAPEVFTYLAGAGGRHFACLASGEDQALWPAWVEGETRSTVVVREGGSGRTTVMNALPAIAPSAQDVACVEAAILSRLAEGSVLVISGSIPGSLPEDHLDRLIRRAHELGALCIVDSTGRGLDAGLRGRTDIVRLNCTEAEDALKRLGMLDPDSLTPSGDVLASALVECGANSAVVGVGEDGSWIASAEGIFRVPTARVTPFLTLGAGDSFVAGLATQLLQGAGLLEAAAWGNACAAVALTSRVPGRVDPRLVAERHKSIIAQLSGSRLDDSEG